MIQFSFFISLNRPDVCIVVRITWVQTCIPAGPGDWWWFWHKTDIWVSWRGQLSLVYYSADEYSFQQPLHERISKGSDSTREYCPVSLPVLHLLALGGRYYTAKRWVLLCCTWPSGQRRKRKRENSLIPFFLVHVQSINIADQTQLLMHCSLWESHPLSRPELWQLFSMANGLSGRSLFIHQLFLRSLGPRSWGWNDLNMVDMSCIELASFPILHDREPCLFYIIYSISIQYFHLSIL